MSKIFSKLTLGDVVASSGNKCFKKLIKKGADADGYLTFSSPDNFTLKTNNGAKNWDGVLEYSTDTNTWSEWDGATTLSADSGKLYLRGTGNTVITGHPEVGYGWVLDGSNIACDGNIENLLDYATVSSGEHPTMAEECFSRMFFGCGSLTRAPALPATTLSAGCYAEMFFGCGSLTRAPALPATTLATECYCYMFAGCTSLTTAPALPATTLAERCYCYMFWECTSLTTAPALPAKTLAERCYCYMFWECTSLTTAPALPATTLAESCYHRMFYNCSGIKMSTTQTEEYKTAYRIPINGEGTTATDALKNMFMGTGGAFTGTPEINTTYYASNEVVY